MLVYAMPTDVEKWMGEPAPEGVVPLIRRASTMVGVATRMARYDVTPAGGPADTDVADAMRDAVCAQVAAWHTAGVDPSGERIVAKVAATSIDGVNLTYGQDAASAERDRVATTLCSEAWDILTLAGLAGGKPWQR